MGRVFEFIANSSDGVFAVDRRQSIVLWNARAAEILGFNSEEVLGKKCYGIVRGHDVRGCTVCRRGCDAISSAERLRPAATMDIAVQTKRGDDIWLNLSTVVVQSRRGDLSVLVHLFREVTRQHDVLSAAQKFGDMVSGSVPGKRARSSRSLDFPGRSTCVDVTRREREILVSLASGFSTEVIADKLCISPSTVRNHVNNILGKLDVHSRLEAVAYSIKNGLL